MRKRNYDIPDSMATEIIAEAVRLYAEANKSYSFSDLQQACLESQIPQYIIDKAVINVEEKQLKGEEKKQQLKEYTKQQIKRGITIGTALLIPAVAIFSIFIFRRHLELISSKNPSQLEKYSSVKYLTVKKGKLEYLDSPKGLSIAVYKTETYDSPSVSGIIGTDGYKSLNIENTECKSIGLNEGLDSRKYKDCKKEMGKLGQSYEYKGKYNYRVKIIEVNKDNVKFQIEKQGKEAQSVAKRLEEEIEDLKKQRNQLKNKIEIIEDKNNEKISEIKRDNYQKIREIEKENNQNIKEIEKKNNQNIKEIEEKNNQQISEIIRKRSEIERKNSDKIRKIENENNMLKNQIESKDESMKVQDKKIIKLLEDIHHLRTRS